MTDDTPTKRKPGAGFYAAVLLALSLTYVLSFGPACYLLGHGALSRQQIKAVYRPVFSVVDFGPSQLSQGIWDYARWWGGESAVLEIAVLYLIYEPEGLVSNVPAKPRW